MSESGVFVGIDVSKAHLDVGVSGSDDLSRFPNSDRGVADLVQRIGAISPTLVVMEATGGFEFPAAAALGAAGVAVAGFLKQRHRYEGRNAVVVLCGANVDPATLKSIL